LGVVQVCSVIMGISVMVPWVSGTHGLVPEPTQKA
jgi:hypothetical protein